MQKLVDQLHVAKYQTGELWDFHKYTQYKSMEKGNRNDGKEK